MTDRMRVDRRCQGENVELEHASRMKSELLATMCAGYGLVTDCLVTQGGTPQDGMAVAGPPLHTLTGHPATPGTLWAAAAVDTRRLGPHRRHRRARPRVLPHLENGRPRQVLNWRTPAEAYHDLVATAA